MKRPIIRLTVLAVLLLALAACGRSQNNGPVQRSSGTIVVNGPGASGSVHANTSVFYLLQGVRQGQSYTLRTELGLLSDETTTIPDGALMVDIYPSEDAFKNNQPTEPVTVAALGHPNQNVYEAHFIAQAPSGDYVAVIRGASLSDSSIQFFYDLRLMSADPAAAPPVLTSFATTTTPAGASQPLEPGYLNVYNGGLISSGVYSISLVSDATATAAYPQMFVYKDSTLTIKNLMLSSISTASHFTITRFENGAAQEADIITGETFTSEADIISGVTFTSEEGPFIVLKGMQSTATYTLTIGL